MENTTSIQFLKHSEIDKQKWDTCIENAHNSLIYGYSFYLNTMSKNWDALVLNDYEAVMPLTWNKKFGIRYLYQPAFTQQLGIFSETKLTTEIVATFLQLAKTHFKFGEIFLNYENEVLVSKSRNNYIINLHKEYQELQSNYTFFLLRKLKFAQKSSLTYSASNNFKTAIALLKKHYSARLLKLKNADFECLEILCQQLSKNGKFLMREVSDEKNNLLTVSIVLQDKKRLYLILTATTPKGKKLKAQHFLIDHLIKEFANQPLLLDFEGSSIPGIEFFFQQFGPINQPFPFVKWNNLPWPIKFLK